jgi:hypothetical protein
MPEDGDRARVGTCAEEGRGCFFDVPFVSA